MGKGPSSFYSSVWLCDVTAPEVVVVGGGGRIQSRHGVILVGAGLDLTG